MTKISELLEEDLIILELEEKDKISVIKRLGKILVEKKYIIDEEKFFEDILQRENLESTGIGSGIAIPHACTKSIKRTVVAFGRSKEGVDFSSIDGKPSHIIFLIAAPKEQKSEYIMTLAKVSKLLKKEENRKKLLAAETKEEILRLIRSLEI